MRYGKYSNLKGCRLPTGPDGREALKNNEAIFNKTVEILEKKKYLAIFPEASHLGKRKLRTIHKGVSRIYFSAEEKNNFNLNIKAESPKSSKVTNGFGLLKIPECSTTLSISNSSTFFVSLP